MFISGSFSFSRVTTLVEPFLILELIICVNQCLSVDPFSLAFNFVLSVVVSGSFSRSKVNNLCESVSISGSFVLCFPFALMLCEVLLFVLR